MGAASAYSLVEWLKELLQRLLLVLFVHVYIQLTLLNLRVVLHLVNRFHLFFQKLVAALTGNGMQRALRRGKTVGIERVTRESSMLVCDALILEFDWNHLFDYRVLLLELSGSLAAVVH